MGGRGCAPRQAMLAHRTLVQLVLLTPAESPVRTELTRSTRLPTNTQNWKNFRNGEESQRMRGPHLLVIVSNDATTQTTMAVADNAAVHAWKQTTNIQQIEAHPRSEKCSPSGVTLRELRNSERRTGVAGDGVKRQNPRE